MARRTRASTSTRLLESGRSSVRSPAPTALIHCPYPVLRGLHTLRALGHKRKECLELHLGLRELLLRHRIAHDPAPCVEVRYAPAKQRAAQSHAELAVLGEVRPADRAGIPAS